MRRRAAAVFAALGLVFAGLSFRLFEVQVSAHESYAARRDAQGTGRDVVRSCRGTLHDCNGNVIAVSIPVPSIYAVPSKVKDPAAVSGALGFDVAPKLKLEKDFVWLKRCVTDEEAARVAKMPGIGIRMEYDRRYPYGPLGSHVIGDTDLDDKGIEGLEASIETILAARTESGKIRVDGLRGRLSYLEVPVEGVDVDLTVDLNLQRIVEEELDAVVAAKNPKWAVAVAMDPRTGAILALTNRPTFDGNERLTDVRARQNLALTAPYEPGSALKPLFVAWALEQGLLTPQKKFDCEMGIWRYHSRVLHDHHPYGLLTVTEIITKSSNIGMAKIGALILGAERLWKCADAFGLGHPTGIELPLEDGGRVVSFAKWSDFTSTSVPMGHEISVTVLQLVTAMSAIANGGKLMRPFVVNRIVDPSGEVLWTAKPQVVRTVLSARTCETMRAILSEVVKSGTGTKAAVDGVHVAGKTGTTQLPDPATGKYTHEKFISSFIGFAPAEDPRVCIAVVIDEPQGEYYGGAVAAPVVGNIIRRGLPYVK